MLDNREHLVSVTALSTKKQLAFALLIFERMLPSLVAFSKKTGFDDSCYLQAEGVAWAALQNHLADSTLKETCIANAPDTERYTDTLTSYALNTCLAMSDILEFISVGRSDCIVDIVGLARDSLYLYLSSQYPSDVSSTQEDMWIAQHPLMQQEERQEKEDIRFLLDLPDQFDETTLGSLKARAYAQPPLFP